MWIELSNLISSLVIKISDGINTKNMLESQQRYNITMLGIQESIEETKTKRTTFMIIIGSILMIIIVYAIIKHKAKR